MIAGPDMLRVFIQAEMSRRKSQPEGFDTAAGALMMAFGSWFGETRHSRRPWPWARISKAIKTAGSASNSYRGVRK